MPAINKTSLGLNQWLGNEYPKRIDFVEDNKIIDDELIKRVKYTDIATDIIAGIVKFGTETGNAIDAESWKQAIGQSLGGYISKVENKEAGKWYINDLTDGKIYKCIQNHKSTSFDITKFVDITNVGLSDKVENLCEVKKLIDAEIDSRIPQYFSGAKLFKKGNVVTFNGLLGRNLNVVNSPLTILFNLPFKPIDDYVWVSPIFTIRKNGGFEVGTYANFDINKITEPTHLSFTYICE